MKELLSLRFSRAVETYERWAIPQLESARFLVKLTEPAGRVLDLGCGTGFVSRFLPPECDPFGVDISYRMLKAYLREFPGGVLADAERLPFRDRSFDFVLSNFSLHWTDLDRSLPEALRVARRGVGIALPVSGSLRTLGFPFPSPEEILSKVGERSSFHLLREIEIPFRGWDLVRFFHYTGSSINPTRRRLLTRGEIEELLNSAERFTFRVLFLSVRVI